MIYDLNLVNMEDALPYKIIKFPDGQQLLNLTFKSWDSEVKIKARLNNFMDLELILCATQALKERDIEHIELYVPYFLGSRCDRKFEDGGVNYIKTIISPIINSQGYKKVYILDAHSDVLEACINNYKPLEHEKDLLIKFAFNDYFTNIKGTNIHDYNSINLVSPDAGALKKVDKIAKYIGFENTIITATKDRDIKTGEILRTNVPISLTDVGKDTFIFDDICDGGRTFVKIVESIKETIQLSSSIPPTERGKFYLVLSHGIFSKGFTELSKHFDRIYTTNSFKDIVNDPDDTDKEREAKKIIKQFNIF